MKPGIHPQWFETCLVTCSCGHSFTVGSTVEKLRVAICSACHPIFTGKAKLIDTEGLVQKFEKRQQASKKIQAVRPVKKSRKSGENEDAGSRPRSLKEMLDYAKKRPRL